MKKQSVALHITKKLLASALLITSSFTSAEIDPEELLTQQEAFVATAPVLVNGAIKLSWQVAPGYYMYGNQFAATTTQSGIRLGTPNTPMGEIKLDELFGEVEVHRDRVDVFVPIQIASGSIEPLKIETRSQGCADAGVCYPPAKQEWTIDRDLSFSALPDSAASGATMSMSGNLADSFSSFGEQPELLDAADAFRVLPEIIGNNLVVQLQIAENYYMYRDKIQMTFNDPSVKLAAGSFPDGEWIDDPEFGRVEIYRGGVSAIFPIMADDGNYQLKLNADHQGCADIGICYPPISETFDLSANIVTANLNAAKLSDPEVGRSSAANSISLASGTNNNAGDANDWFNRTLSQGKLWKVALAMLGFGLVLAFTACMYPMIPILSGIIIGQSTRDQDGVNGQSKPKAFSLSVVYVLAVAITFGVFGLITATVGGGIGIQAYFQSPWLLIPFSILFVLLALSLFGFYDIQVPAGIQNKLQNYSNQQSGGNFIGVAIMGALSALIIGPCGGPILIAALGYAAASANAISGFVALFFLGLGMGLPLLVIGAGGEKLLPKAGGWMVAVKAIFAPKLVMLLWSALLIISGVYLISARLEGASAWQKFGRGIGVLIIGYGLLVMLGGMTGGSRVTDPFAGSALTLAGPQTQTTNRDFIQIKTRADLDTELAAASASGKTVMLDFYADWCTYCKKFDAYVFPDPRVQNALQNTILIKADVTATDKEDKALMESLGVVLPPAILFFDQAGDEITNARVIGELSADEFHQNLIEHL